MKGIAATLATTLLLCATAFAQGPESNRTIQQRRANQQARIAQGDQSGQLTRGETHHLEYQEHAIHRERRNMRTADNGHLTRSDRRAIASQQNQESRRIARDRHNGNVR